MARHGHWWEYVIPGWNMYRVYQDVTDPDGGKYGKQPDYSESPSRVNDAQSNLDYVKSQKPDEYKSEYQSQISDTQNRLNEMNQKGFSYDYTKDAAYQQYKDLYTRGAELASEDATARAAARSGGYGNSWGTSSGQNAYQTTMNGLSDVANSLYDQAYSEYNTKKSDLSNKLSALQQQESLAQNAYDLKMNKYNNELNSAANEYYDAVSANQQRKANRAAKWGNGLKLAGSMLMAALGMGLI